MLDQARRDRSLFGVVLRQIAHQHIGIEPNHGRAFVTVPWRATASDAMASSMAGWLSGRVTRPGSRPLRVAEAWRSGTTLKPSSLCTKSRLAPACRPYAT